MLRPDRRTRRTFAIALTTLSTLALIWPAAIVAGRPASSAASTGTASAAAPRPERQPTVHGVGRQPLKGNGGEKRTEPLKSLAVQGSGRHAAEGDGGISVQAVPPAAVQATSSGTPPAASIGKPSGPWLGIDQAAVLNLEPPDPWVAVGPDDVVQTVNSRIRFTNREGTIRTPDIDVYDFFAFDELVVGDPNFITGVGQPRFTYDAKRNRWLGITMAWHCADGAGDDSLGFVWGAISTTGDPTGDYYQFYVLYNEYLPDYPGLGTSGDKFTISANELLLPNQADCTDAIDPAAGFPGGSLMTFDWAQMLTFPKLPDGTYLFNELWFSLRPSLQPQGLSNTLYVIGEKILPDPSTTSNVMYLTITGSSVANTLNYSAVQDLTNLGVVPAFVDPPAPRDPGGLFPTTAIDRRPTDAIWQDNVLTFASTTKCDPAGGAGGENRNCARVTQIRTSTATPTRVQDMLIASTGKDTWYPGIGQSTSGILHVVYSQSNASEGISSFDRYQLPSDAVHTLSAPRELADGGAVAYNGNRWGSFVGVAQDPRDTNAVWQGNQYTKSNGTWGTRISELQTEGTYFVPITPVRLLDSRPAFNIGLSGAFQANQPRTVDIAGRLGIPNNAVAITGNLTVVSQTLAGYATVTPNPNPNPPTASLNFPKGDSRGNNLTAPLGATGGVSIVYKAPNGNTTHFVLDVTGYFVNDPSKATYKTLTPVRILDTRPTYNIGLTGAFRANVNRQFQVRGAFGIPNDAIAVTGNLAVTGQTSAGYVSLSSTAPPATPATSNLNFPGGDTRANGVTIKLSTSGTIFAVYKAPDNNTAHLIFDVSGYYVQDPTGARFVPLTPGRRMDTRFAPPQEGLSGPFFANAPRSLIVEPYQGVPANATAITGNLTVVTPTRGGYVTMTPTPVVPGPPATASLNFPAGDIRGNGVTGPLSGPGNVAFVFVASNGSTHLVFDLTGYFR